jgi:pyruvate formate lyase activating enzyme
MRIHSIETFGTHEGPGIRFVIFVQGCNFRCIYCHNPDTQTIRGGRIISVDELVKKIENEQDYFANTGGVTVSGGEPLLQAKEITELFTILRKKKIHTCIDTNGSIFNADVQNLLTMTELVLLDVKHIDSSWHKKITGGNNTTPLAFASYLETIHKPFWLRYVLVPQYTDQGKYIQKWASHFCNFKALERVEILPYHTLGNYKYEELGRSNILKNTSPPTNVQIEKAKKIMSMYLRNVSIR